MDYRAKYLKYKTKYLDLKAKVGGEDPPCNTIKVMDTKGNLNVNKTKKQCLSYKKDTGNNKKCAWNTTQNTCIKNTGCSNSRYSENCNTNGGLCEWNNQLDMCGYPTNIVFK